MLAAAAQYEKENSDVDAEAAAAAAAAPRGISSAEVSGGSSILGSLEKMVESRYSVFYCYISESVASH